MTPVTQWKPDERDGTCRNHTTDDQVEQMMPAMWDRGHQHRAIDDAGGDQGPPRTSQRIGHDDREDGVPGRKGNEAIGVRDVEIDHHGLAGSQRRQ